MYGCLGVLSVRSGGHAVNILSSCSIDMCDYRMQQHNRNYYLLLLSPNDNVEISAISFWSVDRMKPHRHQISALSGLTTTWTLNRLTSYRGIAHAKCRVIFVHVASISQCSVQSVSSLKISTEPFNFVHNIQIDMFRYTCPLTYIRWAYTCAVRSAYLWHVAASNASSISSREARNYIWKDS